MKVFVCFLAIVAVCCGQAETQVEENCDRACAFNYDPVCCTYADGSTLTHGNACAASVYNCNENITPTTTVNGECATEQPTEPACSDMMCPAVYSPVCCTYEDGSTRTFGNGCEASNTNCQDKITPTTTVDGECAAVQPTEPACPQMMCIEMYDPVCCTYADGSTRTFGSACDASNINCQEGKSCEKQTKGECRRFHILPYPKRPYIFVPIDTPAA